MAITNATHLADFGTGIGTDGSVLKVDQANSRVGLGTTNPTTTVTVGPIGAAGTSLFVYADARVTGIITATGFHKADGTVLGGSAGKFATTAAGINTTTSVGVGTTRPDSIARVNNTKILNVGILTAYQLYGDGSNLSGISTAAVPGISTQLHSVLGTVKVSGVSTFAGNIVPNTDSSTDIGLTGTRWRNAYVDTYYGDGSNLTGIEGGVAGVNTTGFSTFKDVKHAGISTFVGIVSCSDVVSTGIVTADGFSAGGRTVVGVFTGFAKQHTYYTWGTHTWTKPSDLSKIRVFVTGGGGGGHGNSGSQQGGGGGGGGGTAIKVLYAPQLSATETVTVGSAGTAVNGSTPQSLPGGTSSFGSHCSATGGGGGIVQGGPGGYGGVGGTATGGDLNIDGQGVSQPGTGLKEAGSNGGSSYWGGGGRGSRHDPTYAHGTSGTYGAGGGGANEFGNAGTGGLGVVVVEEYY